MRSVLTATVPRAMPTLMPAKFQSKLRYHTTFQLSPTVNNSVKTHTFSANGLYDPDITAVGHQPRGFDQLMSLYSHYTVNKAVMRIYVDTAAPYDGSFVFGIYEDVNTGTHTDPQDVMEKSKIVSRLHAAAIGVNSAKYTCYPNRRLGYNNPDNLENTAKGSSSNNPLDQIYLKTFCYFPSTQHSVTDVVFVCTIDYTATFSELVQPGKS